MLVIIVMSVLMILGTAMISLAVSSYKFRSLEQNKKTSLYASEAGLDEAYGIMGTFVRYGINQGNKAVEEYDKNFDSLIKVERYKVEHKELSDYIDENGVITKATVEADKERVFEEGYKASTTQSSSIDYMENGERVDIECYDKGDLAIEKEKGYKNFIETGLSSEDHKLSLGGMDNLIYQLNNYSYKINVSSDDEKNVNAEPLVKTFDGDEPIEISVESTYTYNSTPRTTKATYEINVAKYNVQYNLLPDQIVKIPKNPMWSKALMVNGDVEINGGNVVIGNDSNLKDTNNTGIYVAGKELGIDIKSINSKLKVTGNLVTNKDLMISYNKDNIAENKNVEVIGNIYGRNIIINNNILIDAEGNHILQEEKKGEINVKKLDETRDGSVYLMDDLEINGEKSTVDIAGSYYGVSDGSEGERNNPDNSSSIIINTGDIGKQDVDGSTIDNKSALTIGKNVYIAGTSYIDLSNKIKYQTGESLSIVGNYRAYTLALPFTDEYLAEDIKNKDNIRYKEDNVLFDYIDPLTLVTKYKQGDIVPTNPVEAVIENNRYLTVLLTQQGTENLLYETANSFTVSYDNNTKTSKKTPLGKYIKLNVLQNIGDNVSIKLYKDDLPIVDESNSTELDNIKLIAHTQLNAFDKSEYFQEYYKQFPIENGLNLGEGITINNDIKDPGIENIHAGSIFTSQNSSAQLSPGNWNIDLDMKVKARSIQLKNQLFYMGLVNDYTGLASSTNVDDISDSSGVVDNNYYGIDDLTQPEVTIEKNIDFSKLPLTVKHEVKNNEVIILDKDENSTYVLKGKNASNNIHANATDIDLPSGNEYKGVIITKGNIIISGELNFKGTIICNGNLTFEGEGEKKINYDKAYLESFALNNYQLFKEAFSDVGEYATDNASNYLFAKVYDSSNSISNTDVGFKLINRKKWELIK